ncbi:M3 family metallopeptidase [Saccharicrinis fermentans]|nr:M3 family metallopeptidase [Saccharicrinis fermentans]
MDTNPLLEAYNTPFEIAPFEQIKPAHFMPAFEAGIKQQQQNIKAIAENPETPTFANTIEALEYSNPLLTKVSSVFYNLTGANTNDSLKAIAQQVAPLLSKLNDDIYLNESLFSRIKTLYSNKDQLNLTSEQAMLLEKKHKAFVRGGANLPAESKDEFRRINEELSILTLQFGDNVLNETNNYIMLVDNKEELAGLSKGQIDAAAKTAQENGHEGKWAFTTQRPSITPFLQYSTNRKLREKLFKAYINRGDNNNQFDNKENIQKIVSLRVKRAQLLGYKNHAAYILEQNMAKTPETVNEKLAALMKKSLKVAKQELADMQRLIDAEGGNFKLQPWDWWYYAEKVKKEKYDLDESEIRPYFELNNVVKGIFYTANNLYGLKFERRTDLPTPHPDAISYEVKEADGSHIGILFMDFHPRASKRGGAWMSSYRKQEIKNGASITPIITMVCNFTKPTNDTPALLSFDEVTTLFHEFGHALHGLLSKCHYYSLSGTSVPRDFVELPSQVMEHWAAQPELLKVYGKHYQTGEVISDELIAKIQKSAKFNQGFMTTEYLAAAILDMDYHTLTEPLAIDPNTFEKESLDKMNLIPEIVSRYRSTYFNHVFSGGYSAGYYAYIWSAILDSDAFQAFRENGIFDKETATKFRKNILERGGTEDPMVLYKKFRGAEPDEKALLKDRGLI